jgi:chemotaxis protein methyltransferase CheR
MSSTLALRKRTKPVSISEFEFHKFCEFFYRRTGIAFHDAKRYYVDKRLMERIERTGSEDFEHYFNALRRHGANEEIERLINLFTINETFFYREAHQFAALAHDMLPEITARKPAGTPIRIWSLPCATGAEPYSIVMYLLENWPGIEQTDVEIIASDIDTAALAAAAAGVFESRALQRLAPELVKRYFTETGPDCYQISSALRQAVQFRPVNASDAGEMRAQGRFDVIFCRNMLIYFDDKSRLKTVEACYDVLNPGGFICLGHSESMSRISPLFDVRAFPDAIVYQKPGGAL